MAGLALQPVVLAQTTAAATIQPANVPFARLKSAHQLLMAANADYSGHRTLAAQHVRNAMKQLESHHAHRKVYVRSVAAGVVAAQDKAQRVAKPATHESQAASDTQLQQAQQILQSVLMPLGSSHPKAATHVKAAIAEDRPSSLDPVGAKREEGTARRRSRNPADRMSVAAARQYFLWSRSDLFSARRFPRQGCGTWRFRRRAALREAVEACGLRPQRGRHLAGRHLLLTLFVEKCYISGSCGRHWGESQPAGMAAGARGATEASWMLRNLGIVQVCFHSPRFRSNMARRFGGRSLLEWVIRRVTDSVRLDGVIAVA